MDVPPPLFQRLGGVQVATEHGPKRVGVGEVEVPERSDRDVELHRVGILTEGTARAPAIQRLADPLDERVVQRPDGS